MFKLIQNLFGAKKFAEAEALKNQGNVHLEAQDYIAAESCYRKALLLAPKYAHALNNLGLALKYQRRLNDAKAAFESAVAIDTTLERAWYHLGTIAAADGNNEQAIEMLRRVIALDPSFATCYQDLALLQFTDGDADAAEQTLLEGIAFNPESSSLHLDLGNIYLKKERFDESFQALTKGFEKIDEIDEPWYWDSRVNLGVVMSKTGRLDEAENLFRDMIKKFPDIGTLYSDLGMVMLDKGFKEQAAEFFRTSMAKDPSHKEAFNNYAFTMQQLGNQQEAADYYQKLIESNPGWSVVQCNYGTLLQEQNRLQEALSRYELALEADPDDYKARFNRSLLLLLMGNFEAGWKDYEARWLGPEGIKSSRKFKQPKWLGDSDLQGKTLLIHTEQGYGDVIQFIRFAEPLVQTGARIILEVPEPLLEMCKSLPFAADVFSYAIYGKSSPTFDVYCPMMSLPLALGMQSEEDLPCRTRYFSAPQVRAAHWANELRGTRKKVGVVWSGNPKHVNDKNRSIPLQIFAQVFDNDTADFFVIQQDVRAGDLPHLPTSENVHNLAKYLTDFSETAAIIENLDLVVTVDTSVAHLAAAMGKPVWILISKVPDFRWLLDRSDSPWYQGVTLYRQPEVGDWLSVIAQIRKDLARL